MTYNNNGRHQTNDAKIIAVVDVEKLDFAVQLANLKAIALCDGSGRNARITS